MKKLSLLILIGLTVLAAAPAFVLAGYNRLPEMMVGQTTAAQNGKTYYGGFTGNEAVLNYTPDILLGFINSAISNCFNAYSMILPSDYWSNNICHQLELNGLPDPYGNGLGLANLHSKTSIDGKVILQTAALFQKPKLILGDTYGYYNNFAYWGRNLAETPGGENPANASWKMTGYQLNSAAQSSLNSAASAENKAKIKSLYDEAAAKISNKSQFSIDPWYLQNDRPDNINIPNSNNSAPEGKIWKYESDSNGAIKLGGSTTYHYYGKGTIIFSGTNASLEMKNGAKLLPVDANARLGLIFINGAELILDGDNDLQAAVYVVDDDFTIKQNSDNINFYGSLVAKNITIPDSSNNVRFYYDANLSRDWPPGFRYLDLPMMEEK